MTQTTGVITVNLEMLNHPIMLGSVNYYSDYLTLYDLGSDVSEELDVGVLGNPGMGSPESSPTSDGTSGAMNGVMSPDGRLAYYGHRNQPAMIIADLVNGTVTNGDDLTGNNNLRTDGLGLGTFGHVRAVTMSPDNRYLYAVVNEGSSTYECSTSYTSDDMTLQIVRVERETMTVVDRLVLLTGVREAQARRVTLSADGTRGAVAIRTRNASSGTPAEMVQGKLFVIDMTTMSIIDGDPQAGDQMAPFDTSAVGLVVSKAVMSPGGDKVYVAINDAPDAALRLLDVATATFESLPQPTFGLDDTRVLEFGPDGRLYWLTKAGFAIYDPADDTLFEPSLVTDGPRGSDSLALSFAPDAQSLYLQYRDARVAWYDISTDAQLLFPGTGLAYKANDRADEGHGHLISRY